MFYSSFDLGMTECEMFNVETLSKKYTGVRFVREKKKG